MVKRLIIIVQLLGWVAYASGFLFQFKGVKFGLDPHTAKDENDDSGPLKPSTFIQKVPSIFANAVAFAFLTAAVQERAQAIPNVNNAATIMTSDASNSEGFDASKWLEQETAAEIKQIAQNEKINEQALTISSKTSKLSPSSNKDSLGIAKASSSTQNSFSSVDVAVNTNIFSSLFSNLPSLVPVIAATFFAGRLQAGEQMKEDIATYEQSIEELRQQLNMSQSQLSLTNSSIFRLEQSITDLQQQVKNKDQEVLARVSEINSLSSSLKIAESARVTETKSLQLKNDQLQQEIENLRSQLIAAQDAASNSQISTPVENSHISISNSQQLEEEISTLKSREEKVMAAIKSFFVETQLLAPGIAGLMTVESLPDLLNTQIKETAQEKLKAAASATASAPVAAAPTEEAPVAVVKGMKPVIEVEVVPPPPPAAPAATEAKEKEEKPKKKKKAPAKKAAATKKTTATAASAGESSEAASAGEGEAQKTTRTRTTSTAAKKTTSTAKKTAAAASSSSSSDSNGDKDSVNTKKNESKQPAQQAFKDAVLARAKSKAEALRSTVNQQSQNQQQR